MRRLLHDLDLFDALRARIAEGMPVFGTCAGLILLAKQVDGGVPCFATMDIAVKRNAYGRQLGSFFTNDSFEGLGTLPMTFIRAPYIESVSGGAKALAVVGGKIVAARQDNQLVTAFHPENLTAAPPSTSIFSKCKTKGRSKKERPFCFRFV